MLLALGEGEDERGVGVRLLGLLAAHLQVGVLNVGGRLWSSAAMTATNSVASLALMKGCIASLMNYCCCITQNSFSSKRLGELGRALDGRDVVNERLGRLAVQLGFLEDDERLLVSSEPTVIVAMSDMS